jgi:CRISPR-associated protein Cas6
MNAPDMIDLIFDLDGGVLASDYPFELWQALIRRLPELAQQEHIGILPLRQPDISADVSLPRRAKLTLRLPASFVGQAESLSGHKLEMQDSSLQLGTCKTRRILHAPTLNAQLVSGNFDEVQFMNDIQTHLSSMGIKGKMICGNRRTLSGKSQRIQGYGLVLHDLSPDASVQLQYFGIGEARHFGCGIFVPYKVISGLEQ